MSEHSETLLWQGYPGAHIDWGRTCPMRLAIGFAALAAPLTPVMVLINAGSPLWMLFLPILVFGAWLLVGIALFDAIRRRGTCYYLSDQRLVVDTFWPWGARRNEWPLGSFLSARPTPRHVVLDLENPDGGKTEVWLEYLDDARQTADQVNDALTAARPLPETRFRDRNP